MKYQNLRCGEFNDIVLLHARGLAFYCMLEGRDTTEKLLHFAASGVVKSLHCCIADLAANVLSERGCGQNLNNI